jgi:hypothetical protein
MDQPRIIVDPVTWLEVVVPSFASEERALRRSRRFGRGEVERLRLVPDFGCVLPLWEVGGPALELAQVSAALEF